MTAKEIFAKRDTLKRVADEASSKLSGEYQLPWLRCSGCTLSSTEWDRFDIEGTRLSFDDAKRLYEWLGELKPWEK